MLRSMFHVTANVFLYNYKPKPNYIILLLGAKKYLQFRATAVSCTSYALRHSVGCYLVRLQCECRSLGLSAKACSIVLGLNASSSAWLILIDISVSDLPTLSALFFPSTPLTLLTKLLTFSSS